jgi:hypothetical protein
MTEDIYKKKTFRDPTNPCKIPMKERAEQKHKESRESKTPPQCTVI